MRCRQCQYQLWNLRERRCPECGTSFLPSEFGFTANSVEFCCPHCDQTYYGVDRNGHLQPKEFTCVSCGQPVAMDEMVLRPAPGWLDADTEKWAIPWEAPRQRGLARAWLHTVGLALVKPLRLMEGPEPSSTSAGAWSFALFTTLLIALLASAPMCVVIGGMAAFSAPGGAAPALFTGAGVMVVISLIAGVIAVLFILPWGAIAHGILRLTGTTDAGLERTYHALCYGSGANVVTALPCLGLYFGWLWWLISAIFILKRGQRVSAGRAVLAVLPFPLLSLATAVGLYAWWMISLTSSTSIVTDLAHSRTRSLANRIMRYAMEHDGRGPAHATFLWTAEYLDDANDFVLDLWPVDLSRVPVGDTTLGRFTTLPLEDARPIAQAAADALPADVIAHRVGDFVFTYHGIDFDASNDPNLWLVIAYPDPDAAAAGASRPDEICVGQYDVFTYGIDPEQFGAALEGQNTLRKDAGLPPLPHPRTITHGNPARAPATSQPTTQLSNEPAAP